MQHPLTRWRSEQGLTLRQVAAKLDCSIGFLSDIENFKKNPSLTFLDRIRGMAKGALRLEDFMRRPVGRSNGRRK